MTDREIDVIAAGHVCLDIIPKFEHEGPMTPDQVFTPGKLVSMKEAAICTGGPVSNTGIAISMLGLKVSFIARVGDDTFGKITIDKLKETAGVEGITISSEENSSYTLAIAPPGIDRIFFHSPGTNNTFCSADIDTELCGKAKMFHLGYPPLMRKLYADDGRELIAVFKQAKEAGATTSFDMAIPDSNSEAGRVNWRNILEGLFKYIDIAVPSIEEMLFMADRPKYDRIRSEIGTGDIIDVLDGSDYTELSDLFIKWGAAVVVLKSGHRGYYIRTSGKDRLEKMGAAKPGSLDEWADREIWVPAFTIDKIMSATGSGDSSIAGFITAYIRGKAPEEAGRYATALGYQNLTELDALSGIKGWEAAEEMVSDMSRDQIKFDLKDEGWSFDDSKKMWIGPNDKKN